jgi:general stress protein 26
MEGRLDSRFSAPDATATPWEDTERALRDAELYWITTVRPDGRPHVTPLIGVWFEGAMHFTTGLEEQKGRNLEHNASVALTTGTNTWAQGLDVVVEGRADRVTDRGSLERLASAIEAKYGAAWHFDIGDGVFLHSGGANEAAVFRVEPSKVIAFAKDPHAQTTYRLATTM